MLVRDCGYCCEPLRPGSSVSACLPLDDEEEGDQPSQHQARNQKERNDSSSEALTSLEEREANDAKMTINKHKIWNRVSWIRTVALRLLSQYVISSPAPLLLSERVLRTVGERRNAPLSWELLLRDPRGGEL